MKTISWLIGIYILLFSISCSKSSDGGGNGTPKTIPTITTTPISTYTNVSAQTGGNITSDGGASITARGVCWTASLTVTPTIGDLKSNDGSGTGSFTTTMSNLLPNTQYNYRAYATNSVGTAYGEQYGIVTLQTPTLPTVTTEAPSNIKSFSVSTGGNVTDAGTAPVTDRGICWGTTLNPTITANTVIPYGLGGIGAFSSYISTLTVHTTYHVRAYATSSVGTAYGNDVSFTTVYTLGEGLGGGLIFYLDASNNHGLIVTTNDLSGGARWNNTSNPYSNINAYSTSNGVSNTNAIISAIGSSGHAAAICRAYTGGGYTDWYLPSINELYQLYLQKAIIGNFQSYFYWSSTASSTYVANAWAQDFGSGYSYDDRDKTYLYLVRAIRAF